MGVRGFVRRLTLPDHDHRVATWQPPVVKSGKLDCCERPATGGTLTRASGSQIAAAGASLASPGCVTQINASRTACRNDPKCCDIRGDTPQ